MSFRRNITKSPARRDIPSWRGRCFCLALCLFLILVIRSAQAHGELLIRIAAVTRQIEAATNEVARLFLQRGDLYREDRNWLAAEADYRHAAQLDPALAGVELGLARLKADSDDLPAALLLFNGVINRNANDGEALAGRARVLMRLGQESAAIKDYNLALKFHPQPQHEYFLEYAQLLMHEQNSLEALRVLDEGIKKFGPIVPLQEYAIQIELELKKYTPAIARLDTIIELIPRKEAWLARRGEVLLLANQPEEARKSFKASLREIDLLPKRLQQGPAMLALQDRVRSGLSTITSSQPRLR